MKSKFWLLLMLGAVVLSAWGCGAGEGGDDDGESGSEVQRESGDD